MALSGAVRHDTGAVLTFPDRLLAASRARIEAVIEAADRAFKTGMARAVQVAPGPIMFTPTGAREDVAVQVVTALLDQIVEILGAAAERAAWTGPELHAAVEDVSEQAIIRSYRVYAPTTIELDPFIVRMRDQLHARPAWTELERTITALPSGRDAEAERPPDRRPLLALKEAAKQLKMSVRTLERMAKAGKVTIVTLAPKTRRISPAEVDRLLRDPKYRYR